MKRVYLIILLCLSAIIAGCGANTTASGSDAPKITPINPNDTKSLQGTYSIDSAYVSCSDGSSYKSSSPSTTTYYGYYAYDGKYDYWDYYYANAASVLLDDSYRELVSFNTITYKSNVTYLSDYSFKVQYFGVPSTGGVFCDETYHYTKISDNLQVFHFRFIRAAIDKHNMAMSAPHTPDASDATQQTPSQAAPTSPQEQPLASAAPQPAQGQDQPQPADQTTRQQSGDTQAQPPMMNTDQPRPDGDGPQQDAPQQAHDGDQNNLSATTTDTYDDKSAEEAAIKNRSVFRIPNMRATIMKGGLTN